jgi:hypothetical protein
MLDTFRFLPILCLGAGCGMGSSGALGQTEASPECSASDLVCAVAGIDAPIATGATLPINVSVTSEGSAAPPLSFVSANPGVFTVDVDRIHGQGPGVASLLVTTTGDLVVDFLNVFVAEAESMRLHQVGAGGLETSTLPPAMQMLVGDDLTLVLAPHAGAQRLLGEVDATWDADAAVVKLLDEGTPGSRRVIATAPGKTTLTAEALGITAQVTLEVVP